jgi:hypothetical protein
MSFIVPPLPGERLLTPKEVARRADCHITAIYNFIKVSVRRPPQFAVLDAGMLD